MAYCDICDSASHRECSEVSVWQVSILTWRPCDHMLGAPVDHPAFLPQKAEMKAHNAISTPYHSLQIFKIDEHISKFRTWNGTRDS